MTSQVLLIEDSSISDSDSESLDAPPVNRRGKAQGYNWAKVRSYSSTKEAIPDLKLQNLFWKHSSHSTEEGEKIRFNCKYSRACAAKLYILCESTSQKCILYKTPSTNNFLEATNKVVKDKGTLRSRLPVGQFFDAATSLLNHIYIARDPESQNSKLFVTVPTLKLKLQTEAYNWTRSKPVINQFRTIRGDKYYFVTPTNKPSVEGVIEKYLKQRQKLNWRTFAVAGYQNHQTRLWLVIMSDDWLNATCTCSKFLKQYICKHVMGIAIINNKYQVPDEAKTIPLGERRKRGRPSKAKRALVVQ